MKKSAVMIVPCAPGWRVLYKIDEPEWLLVGEAIVAWFVTAEVDENYDDGTGNVRGITTSGVAEGSANFFGFLRPDGWVEQPYSDLYFTITAARKAVAQEETDRKAAQRILP